MSFELVLKKARPVSFFYSPRLFLEVRILVVFTTRQGGMSPPPFDSLNLGLHVGDSRKNVLKNRRLLLSGLNLDINALTTAEQVHGNLPVVVDEGLVGRGAESHEDSISGADALITDLGDVPLALFFADCVPVVLAEPIKRCIALIHAGWRGIVGDIIEESTSMLVNTFKAEPGNLLAFIGPSIGPCCYEVSGARFEEFQSKFGSVFTNGKIDLPECAEKQLTEAGIPLERIIRVNICTSCRHDIFFSYRKAQVTGRQGGLVALLEKE